MLTNQKYKGIFSFLQYEKYNRAQERTQQMELDAIVNDHDCKSAECIMNNNVCKQDFFSFTFFLPNIVLKFMLYQQFNRIRR